MHAEDTSSLDVSIFLTSDPWIVLYIAAAVSLTIPQDNFHGRYNESEYEMSDFWATSFTANLFGVANSGYVTTPQGRSSLEVEHSALPMFAQVCTFCPTLIPGQGYNS